jgi:hypothetical protein
MSGEQSRVATSALPLHQDADAVRATVPARSCRLSMQLSDPRLRGGRMRALANIFDRQSGWREL